MSKKDMILALIEHYSNGNKAQFASLLGISPQGLSTWIKRESFDIELIFSKCEDLSAQWLLTGEGPMLKTDTSATDGRHTTAPEAPEAPAQYVTQLLNTIRELSEQIGRLKARIEELERRRGDNAGCAQSSDIANVG